jgi:carbonic anhydrase/acetyltransferase-like protein (isoleucine patch superfamily)
MKPAASTGNKYRMSLYSIGGIAPQLDPSSYVHESATVIGDCQIGSGSSVWPGAVVRADNDKVIIGNRVNIQDGAVIHIDVGHPATLNDGVSIGHMAMVHGATIGENTLIGMQAVILNDAVIGKNCIIGANTVVSGGKVIPDNSLVIGTPGKIMREVTADEIENNRRNADGYASKSAQYKTSLIKVK